MRAAFLVDRVRPARENDALGSELELGQLLRAWKHLREDVELSKTAGDPLHLSSVCPTSSCAQCAPGTGEAVTAGAAQAAADCPHCRPHSTCNIQVSVLRAVAQSSPLAAVLHSFFLHGEPGQPSPSPCRVSPKIEHQDGVEGLVGHRLSRFASHLDGGVAFAVPRITKAICTDTLDHWTAARAVTPES